MTIAREIIARHLCTMAAQGWSGISPFERAAYRTTAAGMVEAVTSAGFRIVGPDDVAQLERIAKGDIPGVWQEKFEKAQKIARAIGRNNDEADGR